MIDPTPMYLYDVSEWPDCHLDSLMEGSAHYELPDNRRARRVAVLVGEAIEAGQIDSALAWLCDVGRLLLKLDPGCDPDGILRTTLSILHEAPGADLPDVDLPAEPTPGQFLRSRISWLHSDGLDSALIGWEYAQHAIALVAAAAGENAESAIERCAELAYARLFGVRNEAASKAA